MVESIGNPLHWLQLGVSLVCIAFGLLSTAQGNRLLVPLGIVLLSGAVFFFSRDSSAAVPVGATALLTVAISMLWVFKLTRSLRSDVGAGTGTNGRIASQPQLSANHLFAFVLAADVFVLAVFAFVTGDLVAAFATLLLVTVLSLAIFLGVNRQQRKAL